MAPRWQHDEEYTLMYNKKFEKNWKEIVNKVNQEHHNNRTDKGCSSHFRKLKKNGTYKDFINNITNMDTKETKTEEPKTPRTQNTKSDKTLKDKIINMEDTKKTEEPNTPRRQIIKSDETFKYELINNNTQINKIDEKLQDGMTSSLLKKLINNHKDTHKFYKEINKNLKLKKCRNNNFPSHISENIVKFAIIHKTNEIPNWDVKPGDLNLNKKTLEVKAFSSDGPMSFGPKEKWDELYFIDCKKFMDDKYIIYKIPLSNKDSLWKDIKFNKNDTFYNIAEKGKRPRKNPNDLIRSLKEINKIEIFWEGNIYDILN